ncbi:MAG: amidohydrolase [Saprospiraceae bacterium]|nr:amidohydrolase [Saprospiraceae bacterium]
MIQAAQIRNYAQSLLPELIDIRCHLHQHPELSFKEFETSNYIKSILTKLGISYTDQWAETGIVATIGKQSLKSIALRGDMDALPIQEKNDVNYKSINENVMHACGHDVHMTCLLGAAMILKEFEASLGGQVKLIFQPGEELLPGGAKALIGQGVLNDVNAIFGLHVQPKMDVGTLGFCKGASMASCDEIYIKVIGRGGHAALPDQAVDPIYIASQIIVQLQSIISKEKPPFSPSVLGIGKINSIGGATNIIPDEVLLEGTLRCLNEEWRAKAKKRIREIIDSVAIGLGGRAEITIIDGYPCLMNNEDLTQKAKNVVGQLYEDESVITIPSRMSSEDFAYYSHEIPACFFRLGIGKEAGVHTPNFDVDMNCLPIGAASLASLAIHFSKNT